MSNRSIKYSKKLIEVALPLEDINKEAAYEKSIRHGHPSTLHLWWARRPLAAAHAVLFSQLVNAPNRVHIYRSGLIKEHVIAEHKALMNNIRNLFNSELYSLLS